MARENDKVTLVKKGYEGKIGIIDSEIGPGLFIVRLEDKELVKCLENEFVIMVNNTTPDTIKISRSELRDEMTKAVESIIRETDGAYGSVINLLGTLITKRLEKGLFND